MILATASVIIVSRHRAAALQRCLLGLAQQDHPSFEVIVVADPAGITAARAKDLAIKLIPFDQPNISAARNLGLANAGGEVVAFIDDDAVAEPTWLSRLCAPFSDPQVIASTGFIRGRNGISYQWKACEVDNTGADHPLPAHAATYAGTPERAVKTQGTNCAFRRQSLTRIGGFDPAFRFYLDEADVNLRMAGLGLTTVVPDAQVHHGYAASARRRDDRIPTSLHEIAASIAVFLRRHAPDTADDETIPAIEAQRARIAHLLATRRISDPQADTLRSTLADGWDDGMSRPLTDPAAITGAAPFTPRSGTGPRPGRVIAGRIWQARRLRAHAAQAAANGEIVTLFLLSPTIRAHRHHFTPAGFWEQTGGLFGPSDRSQPRFRWWRFSKRVLAETARVAGFRPTYPFE